MLEKKAVVDIDLFGQEVAQDVLLRDTFIEPPFSVLDTKTSTWQSRKRAWIEKGIKSEIGRDAKAFTTQEMSKVYDYMPDVGSDTSVFDPVLTELMYHWFCPDGGEVLDPFAGGSVRGIVANHLGYKYTGIELRQEQVDSNYEQARQILDLDKQPTWICGDSDFELDKLDKQFDFVFSCPPYGDLEVYSDLPDDLSNMTYDDFLFKYQSIIAKATSRLIMGGYAVFVVGEYRDKKGNYVGFVADTIKAFQAVGMKFYNDAVLLNPPGTAMLRASNYMRNRKLVKIHQNVLCFKKV